MVQQLGRSLALLALASAIGVIGETCGAYPYVTWNYPTMSSTHSSDLGGYPAQNLFSAIGRADWSYEDDSAQGEAGFSLRDDIHGSWHSLNDPNLKQSPSGVMAREWIAADFGGLQTITGADIWNTNWDVINQTRAVKNISIDVSADNINWTTVWTGDLAKAPGIRPHLMYDGVTYVNPSLSSGHAPQYGLLATDRANFGGPHNARYVVINVQSNHGGDPYFALEEIRFLTIPLTIPEPGSFLLSLLGLALGSQYRRR